MPLILGQINFWFVKVIHKTVKESFKYIPTRWSNCRIMASIQGSACHYFLMICLGAMHRLARNHRYSSLLSWNYQLESTKIKLVIFEVIREERMLSSLTSKSAIVCFSIKSNGIDDIFWKKQCTLFLKNLNDFYQ